MISKRGISVVIPNWNGKKLLKKNIPFLIDAMNSYTDDYEIIVVDDASTDESKNFVRKTFPSIKLVDLSQNRGFPIAANCGVKAAMYNYVPYFPRIESAIFFDFNTR